ncbi:MAG TPA: hypothetical protein VK439_00560 [Rubrivivax sp.]|nr:hypothetical protein [Rubrivivax sp.]
MRVPSLTPKPPAPRRAAGLQQSAKCSNPPAVDPLKLADNPHCKHQAAHLIASDVERFVQAGGHIQQLPQGAMSKPLRLHIRDDMAVQAAHRLRVRGSGQLPAQRRRA